MNTINLNDLNTIANTIRAEIYRMDGALQQAEEHASAVDCELLMAELNPLYDDTALEALYDRNDEAVRAYREAYERLQAIRAVNHAFGQAREMLQDYITEYEKDGE